MASVLVRSIAIVGVVFCCSGCPEELFGLTLHRIDVNGDERTYRLSVPPGVEDVPLPLVLVLHGFSQDAIGAAFVTQFHTLGEQAGFITAYPNGLQRSYNIGVFESPDDVAFLLAVIDDVARRHAVDRDRVYLTGISNGGFLTHLAACQAAETFAAVAPVVATLPRQVAEYCAPSVPVPMMLVLGTHDPLVPFDEEREIALGSSPLDVLYARETVDFWLAANGLVGEPEIREWPDRDPTDGSITTRERYYGNGVEVLYYEVSGGGHAWPGTASPLPEFITGPGSNDFRATREIWGFFSRHSRE